MARYRVIPFTLGHVAAVKARSREHAQALLAEVPVVASQLQAYYGRTLLNQDGAICATGGIVTSWPTLGQAFLLCDVELTGAIWTIRQAWYAIVTEFLVAAQQEGQSPVIRLEASAYYVMPEAQRLISQLGFQLMGVRTHWGQRGEPLLEYAQFFDTATLEPKRREAA